MCKRIIPIMPEEFKGDFLKKGDYVKNTPRRWTEAEVNWCLDLKEQGFSGKEIAESVGREFVSVSIKMKRMSKKEDTYNKAHILEKYETNKEFMEHVSPKTVLDVFCGVKTWYRTNGFNVVTNDFDTTIEADYHMDCLKFLCLQYMEGNKYDVVDVDPFGSASHCLELAVQTAKKGLCVTLGEMGHKRFKRLDFVRRAYGIETLEDFTSDNIVKEIQKVGLKYKKDLKVFAKKDWAGISRVWFTISDVKITEQWEQKGE